MAEETISGVDYEYDPLFQEGESKAKRLTGKVGEEGKEAVGRRSSTIFDTEDTCC